MREANRIAKIVGIEPPSFYDLNGHSVPDHDDFIDRLKKALGYENVETVGDYLTEIGRKFEIPIYTDDEHGMGLYWPQICSSDEMSQFPTK